MIGRLVRQDPAIQGTRLGLIMLLLFSASLRPMTAKLETHSFGEVASAESLVLIMTTVLLWGLAFWMLMISGVATRASRLSLALPIEARQAWRARILAILLANVLPMMIPFLIFAWRGWADGRPVFAAAPLKYGIQMMAFMVLTLGLLQIPGRGLQRIPRRTGYTLYMILVPVSVLNIICLTPPSWLWTGLVLAAALALFHWLDRRNPDSFLLQSKKLEPGKEKDEPEFPTLASGEFLPGIASRPLPAPRRSAGLRVDLIIFRTLVNHWIGWLGLGSMALYVALGLSSFLDGEAAIPMGFVAGVWLWVLLLHSAIRAYRLDDLPISRRRLFAHTMMPMLLACLLGLGLGSLRLLDQDDPPRLVGVDSIGATVPLEFMEIARDGQPPLIESPGGEGFRPRARTLVRGLDIALYNPFEHGADASAEFKALQAARALGRVHELEKSPEALLAGLAPDERTPETLCAEARSSASSLRIRTLLLALICGILLLCGLVWLIMPTMRRMGSGPTDNLPQVMMILLPLGLLFVAHAGGLIDMGSILGFFLVQLRRLVEGAGLSMALLGLGALLATALGYWVLQERYARMEFTVKRKPRQTFSEY